MISERCFRTNQVLPFLKTLTKAIFFPIQQVSISGTPDLIGCVDGVFVALELKKDEKAEISALQRYHLEEISKRGGYAFIVHPGNWEEVKKFLIKLEEL